MRKTVLVLLLASAACAPVVQPRPVSVANAGPPAAAAVDCPTAVATFDAPSAPGGARLMLASAALWTPPLPPVPPPPPDTGDFLQTHSAVFTPSGDRRFDAYVARVLEEGGRGWYPYLTRLFAGLKPNPAIVAESEALRKPVDAAEYVRRIVTPGRIANGRKLYSELMGQTLSARNPNVPPEIVLALWGAFSDYGARPPRFDMLETLLNLGACGKGEAFTYFDIYHAASLILEGKVERSRAKAYGNGRIGQVRALIHESGSLGADGDGDGHVDIWTNRADIFANLALNSLDTGMPPVIEVERPQLDRRDPEQARTAEALESPSVFGMEYFRKPGGGAWPREWRHFQGRYVAPFGKDGPFFILTNNFTPLNFKNPYVPRYAGLDEDPGFGIAIWLLAEQIAGRPGPSRPIQ